MRFSFSLQALLNWKRSLEELSQMRLAGMMRRLRAQEEEIQGLMLKRLSYDQKLREKSGQRIPAGEYLLYQQYAEDSLRELLSREAKKKETAREVDEEREKLIGLAREKKILERLREKQWKNFKYQEEKGEEKKNDEMTVMKYPPSPRKRNP